MKKTILLTGIVALCAAALQAAPRPEKTVLAKVSGKPITAGELTDQLWWQYGAQALGQMIDERLLMEEAVRLGIKADPKEVESRFTALASNYADKAQFQKNLKSVGWTEADLRNLLNRQLTIRETVMAAKKIAVTEDEMKKFFETNKEKLGTPESVKLSQIFVNTQAEANAALEALDVGADFGKLSALKSNDPNLKKNNGSVGEVKKGMLLPDIEKEIFSLKPGQHSKAIATANGFSIFLVEEYKAAQPAVYEKVQNELRTAMINQAISQKLPELAAELKQKTKIELVQ